MFLTTVKKSFDCRQKPSKKHFLSLETLYSLLRKHRISPLETYVFSLGRRKKQILGWDSVTDKEKAFRWRGRSLERLFAGDVVCLKEKEPSVKVFE